MPIDQAITKLADKVRDLKPLIDSEVGTKTAFITPFINDVLGYDVSDPREVVPEYTAGTGERVDYASSCSAQKSTNPSPVKKPQSWRAASTPATRTLASSPTGKATKYTLGAATANSWTAAPCSISTFPRWTSAPSLTWKN